MKKQLFILFAVAVSAISSQAAQKVDEFTTKSGKKVTITIEDVTTAAIAAPLSDLYPDSEMTDKLSTIAS